MRLWLLPLACMTEADGEALREGYPRRMAQADRFRIREDRLRCIGAGLLLRDCLGVNEPDLVWGPEGKPALPAGPEFSLSHSGDWIALAADACPLGLDVERVEPAHVRGVKRVCTPEELAWAGEDPARLFQLWTWKEALLKATGRGFTVEPRALSVLPFADGAPVAAEGRLWYGAAAPLEGYGLGLVSARPTGALRLERLR